MERPIRSLRLSALTAVAAMMASGLVSQSVRAQSLEVSPPVPTPAQAENIALPPGTIIGSAPSASLTRAAALRAASVLAHATSAEAQSELIKKALSLGFPLHSARSNGVVGTLVGITSLNEPIYVEPMDISAADTIGADQLWPANSITSYTGFAGWSTGATGYNLSGSGITIGQWEAAVDLAGDASVLTTQDQFTDGAGGSRVLQNDSAPTGDSFHATEVAGLLASAGLDAYGLYNSQVFDYGNESRGIAYASTIDAYNISDVSGTFGYEAGIGTALGNNSYGTTCGWVNGGTAASPKWYWYGYGTQLKDWKFGAYLGVAGGIAPAELDSDSYGAPNTLMVFAAGNYQGTGPGSAVTYYLGPSGTTAQTTTRDWVDGDAGGYNTLPSSACAKDVLTVGATENVQGGYSGPSSVTMASFSSMGPTNDGRIKPDVVAEGIQSGTGSHNPFELIGLPVPFYDVNNPTVNNEYYEDAGTSFSAPSVTGGLALVLQQRAIDRPGWANNGYPPLSSTLRGLAIQTADQVGPNPGPSFQAGYGLFDAVQAVNLMHNDITSGTNPASNGPKPFIKEVQLQNGSLIQFNTTAVSSSTPLKVTICWTDPAGPDQTTDSLDQQTSRLVNHVNLRIYPPGTTTFNPSAATTYQPYILNPDLTNQSATTRASAATTGNDITNNVEQVVVNNPVTTGPYIVQVSYTGTLTDGLKHDVPQWVSILSSGNTIPAVPALRVSITNIGNNQFLLTWPAVVGAVYQFEFASSVLGPYTLVGSPISANLETMSYTATAPAGSSMGYWQCVRQY